MIEQFKMGELAKFTRGEGLRVSKKRNIFYDTNRNSNSICIIFYLYSTIFIIFVLYNFLFVYKFDLYCIILNLYWIIFDFSLHAVARN